MEVEMLARIAPIYGQYIHDAVKTKEFADIAAAVNPGQSILLSAYSAAGVEHDPWKYTDKYVIDYDKPIEEEQPPGDNNQSEDINHNYLFIQNFNRI